MALNSLSVYAYLALLLLAALWTGYYVARRNALRRQQQLESQLRSTAFALEQTHRPNPASDTGPSSEEIDSIEVPDDLAEVCASGQCVLFAGSGIGAQAGLPSWQNGLAFIVSTVGDDSEFWAQLRSKLNEGDAASVAEILLTRVPRDQLAALSRDTYGKAPDQLPAISLALRAIPFASVLTTNWDPLIEQTFVDRKGQVLFPNSSKEFGRLLRENCFAILKLYGDPAQPDSFSFTRGEYRRLAEDNPEFQKYATSLFLSNTMLCIGASLDGIEDFASNLRLRSRPTRKHYAVVPWKPNIEVDTELFLSRYGIQLLPFHPSSGYPEVLHFVERLRDQVATLAPPAMPEIRSTIITRVELTNIGSFRSFSLDLNAGWNVFLGNNGLGKSTLLKAIALGLCGDDEKARKTAAKLLRVNETNGNIRLFAGKDVFQSTLMRDGEEVTVKSDRLTPVQTGNFVAIGFPPLRGVSLRDPEGPKNTGSANPTVGDLLPLLTGAVDTRVDNLKQWLVNVQLRSEGGAQASRYLSLRNSFFRILDEVSPGLQLKFDHVDRKTWQVMVWTQDGVVPIDALSQGMTSVLGWVGALLERMYEIYAAAEVPETMPGLILVDEIAAHMHPEWEYVLVPLIKRNFPNLQVVATTHSPLVVANMEPGEVFHLSRRKSDGMIVAERLEMSFEGLRTDQILTGPGFQMPTTLRHTSAERRERYSVLLGKTRRTPEEEEEFQRLALEIDALPKHPETQEGREALDLLELWMTERIRHKTVATQEKILLEAKSYLSQLDSGVVNQ